MTEEVSELLKRAQAHPVEGWAALAGSLLDSLEETVDPSAEAAWSEEIAKLFPSPEELGHGVPGLLSCVPLTLDGDEAPHWRWRELLAVPSFSN
jgi:hypothetical protein